jgi:hypothetical protein
MGLLRDFETLEKQQTDSIEYYLSHMVLKDRYPITMNLDEFCKEYFAFQNHSATWDKWSPDHCFRTQTNLMEGRVYIAGGVDGSNVSKFASERIVLIGTLNDGFRKITTDELHQYEELYQKQWPDSEYLHTLSQSIHHLFNKYTYILNPYSMYSPVGVAVEDPNRGFNFEMI